MMYNSVALIVLQSVRRGLVEVLFAKSKKDSNLATNLTIAKDAVDRAIEHLIETGGK